MNTCVDCGAEIQARSTRCVGCAHGNVIPDPVLRAKVEKLLETRPASEARALLERSGVSLPYVVVKQIKQTVTRRLKRAGQPRKSTGPRRLPMPADFIQIAAEMNNPALCKHYGVCKGVVDRWRFESKVPSPGREYARSAPETVSTTATRTVLTFHQRPDRLHWEASEAGEAARFLARLGPIYRCTETGKPKQGGSHWNRGGHVLTNAEIIERAERNGWQRRIAA